MAIIGCLGLTTNQVFFEVSAETLRTLDNFQWSGSARYGVHQRHAGNALTEFAGLDPDQIAFDVTFSAQLGTDPMTEIWRLWRFLRNGTTLPLTVGTHGYGRYRWTITGLSVKAKYFDRNGEIYHAVASLKLQEYLRD